MKTKILSLFLMLTIGLGTLFAERVQIGDLFYNLDATDQTAEVTYQYQSRYNYSNLVSADIPAFVTYNDVTYSVTRIGFYAFVDCFGLTSLTIPNSVVAIGSSAFYGCYALTSVVIPNSVTYIGVNAFQYCTSLTSLIIGNSVTSIDAGAFTGCTNLTSVTIPDSVTNIGGYAFQYCTSLTSLIIGNGVTRIGTGAFSDCSSLNSVLIQAETPPTLDNKVFSNTNDSHIYVPCGTLNTYRSVWSPYSSRIEYQPLEYSIIGMVNIVEAGGVQSPQNKCENNIVAVPNYGYHFAQWSDGNTDNPRTIVLTQDTTFIAEFAPDKNGVCGKDSALKWTYEDKSQSLTITGEGDLTENYTFGVEAPSQMKSLIISNDVTSIGDSAFYGMTTINHLTIGGNVASIGNYAFAECKNFDDITCYATTVPTIDYTTFYNVGNKQYIYLYVPADRERAYKRDTWWGQFDIQIMGATSTETTEVNVTPSDNSATIVWPAVTGAATYELVIKDKDGNIICTLIFNENGQLTSIAFNAPGRNAPQQTQSAGFSFTVTGLDNGTGYVMTMTSKDSNGAILQTETISFVTNSPQAIDPVTGNPSSVTRKVIKDGQLFILRADHTYTLTGQEVK